MRSPKVISLIVLTAISFSINNSTTYAQMPNQSTPNGQGGPGMGMILFPVQRGADGQQYIITRAGYKVAVPGIGIDPNASQIATFQDAQNNFYYVNKNGQPTPVSAQQMQSVMAQVQQQQSMRQAGMGQYPQAMPYSGQPGGYPPQAAAPAAAAPAPVQQQSNNNSALMSGLAAAGGAALGAGVTNAISNNNNDQYPSYGYGGTPYGQPIYKSPTGQYYYNNPATGAPSYVTPTASTSSYYNQYGQQQQQKQQMASQAYNTNQANQQQQQQQKEEAASQAYNKNASQQKQLTPQQEQAMQSKEGQESGRRRRFGHGSDQTQAEKQSEAQAVQSKDEQAGGRRGRLGRGEAEQTAGSVAQQAVGQDGQKARRLRRSAE